MSTEYFVPSQQLLMTEKAQNNTSSSSSHTQPILTERREKEGVIP